MREDAASFVSRSLDGHLDQEVLAGLIKDASTLAPLAGVGVYAELRVFQRLEPPVAPSLRPGLIRLPGEDAQQRILVDRIAAELAGWYDATAWRRLDGAVKDRLLADLGDKLAGVPGLAAASAEEQSEVVRQALRELLGELPTPAAEEWGQSGTVPLGRLATDRFGYLSFDLNRVKGAIPTDSRVAPVFHVDGVAEPVAVLDDARVSNTSILGILEVPPVLPVTQLTLPSMQSPSIEDWLLSPASFALPSAGTLGTDGGEQFFPASLGTHSFTFRQVVRLTDGATDSEVGRPGFVDEYEVTWYPLGHSLGEIVHSTGLAPGESVRLAVIDWSWASSQSLGERTSFGEELEHELHRDRLVTESMESTLREAQSGGSVTGGVSVGVAPIAASLGGSYSTTSGSRRAAADTAQRVSDLIGQSTTAFRELRSTVVVTARQEESEAVQTRTFTNYNHAHTLTILHYQILRHFRVVTRWVRRRRVLLVASDPIDWTYKLALQERPVLEPACFDLYAKAGFDALERVMVHWTDDVVNPKGGPTPITQERDFLVESVILQVEVGSGEGETPDEVVAQAILQSGVKVALRLQGLENLNANKAFDDAGNHVLLLTPDTPFRWEDLKSIAIDLKQDNGMILERQGVIIQGAFGSREVKPFGGPRMIWDDRGVQWLTVLQRPGADVPQPLAPKLGRQRAAVEDNKNIDRLMEHLQRHTAFYSRLVRLSRHPDAVAMEFAGLRWKPQDQVDLSSVLDHLDPLPLETFGADVAYERVDSTVPPEQDVGARASAERLVTLPSRGVFTEGVLGHASVAEEIDNTRFWKWEEHPLPIAAPEIAPVQVATPTPQPLQSLAPTALPTPTATVAPVPDLPAPTGLEAMLRLMGTPGIFTDMSGRKEVAELLKGLSDNTVKLDEAQKKAEEIRQKYGAELDKQQKELQRKAMQTQADVLMKAVEAEAGVRRAAMDAQADQQQTKAAQAKAQAAQDLPPEHRPAVYRAAARQLAGKPRMLTVHFHATSITGADLPGPFSLVVTDASSGKEVLAEPSVPGDHSWAIEFSTDSPIVGATVSRLGVPPLMVDDVYVDFLPTIPKVTAKMARVPRDVDAIELELRTDTKPFHIETTSNQEAIDKVLKELTATIKGGVEAKLAELAASIVGKYATEHQVAHAEGKTVKYDLELPTGGYSFTIVPVKPLE